MRVKHAAGTVADVPERKAARLVESGSWAYVDAPPVVEPVQESEDAQIPAGPVESVEAKPHATIAEMRAWAIENGVRGVPPRGKLPRHAIAAYREAHKE